MVFDKGALAAQFLKLRCRDTVSAEEQAALEDACTGLKAFAARQDLAKARELQTQSHLLIEGLVCRHIGLPDGRRQIVALHVPGDFVDLHSFLLQRLEHDVTAIGRTTIAIFPHDRLRRITETHPHLSRMLWLSTLMDAAMHREWVASLGLRSALERLAHLFCELHERMKVIGQATNGAFDLPLNQIDLGDACGLTAVHVNRTLRELRETGLLRFNSKRVEILDEPALAAAAQFDPFYLHLGRATR